MAAVLTGYGTTGFAHPKFIRRRLSDGFWWNTSGTPGFEAYSAASIANYGIAGVEVGATGAYTATDPASSTDGDFLAIDAAGASLVVSDVATRNFWQDQAGPMMSAPALIAALLDLVDGIETDVTPREAARAIAAFAAGNVTNSGANYAAIANSGTQRLAATNPTENTRTVTPTLT